MKIKICTVVARTIFATLLQLLKQKFYIRNTIAAFLLLLFAFGSTPKLFLHNLVANHKDTIGTTKATGTNVAKTPVYCHCDNLVVESPFEAEAPQSVMHLPVAYTILQYHDTASFSLLHHSYFELRGPPALA